MERDYLERLEANKLLITVEIPAGIAPELFDELNKLTHGNIESKVVKTK